MGGKLTEGAVSGGENPAATTAPKQAKGKGKS